MVRQEILDEHKKSMVITEEFLFQLTPQEIDYISQYGKVV